jgi:putative tryptophan/tyrosine transport system substrate-binding protein
MQFHRIRRREFITLLGGTVAGWSAASRAQQLRVNRVGVLLLANAHADLFRKEFREELRKSGYVEGKNVVLEVRSAEEKLDILPQLAAELVALKVDVILAVYTPCAFAAQNASREIPIVVVAGDPLASGLVQSLARPEGNITGISLMATELHGKCVELLRDMIPSVRRIAGIANASDPFSKQVLESFELASKTTGVEITPVLVRTRDEIDGAFATVKKRGAEAVVVQGSLTSKNVAKLALQHHLPAASPTRSFAEDGGLLSYGADEPDAFRRSASFVIKILKGEQPAHMPVEQVAKFELLLNVKTAKALGIEVPWFFQQRADQVIE